MVSGNPLHCNCSMVWLSRIAADDNATLTVDSPTCASPPNLYGEWAARAPPPSPPYLRVVALFVALVVPLSVFHCSSSSLFLFIFPPHLSSSLPLTFLLILLPPSLLLPFPLSFHLALRFSFRSIQLLLDRCAAFSPFSPPPHPGFSSSLFIPPFSFSPSSPSYFFLPPFYLFSLLSLLPFILLTFYPFFLSLLSPIFISFSYLLRFSTSSPSFYLYFSSPPLYSHFVPSFSHFMFILALTLLYPFLSFRHPFFLCSLSPPFSSFLPSSISFLAPLAPYFIPLISP